MRKLLLLIPLLCISALATPAPTANNCNGNSGAGAASCAIGTVTSGNYIIIPFFYSVGDTITSVTDSHSNTFANIGQTTCNAGGSFNIVIWGGPITTGGADTINVNTSGAGGNVFMEAAEISGQNASTPIDGTAVCGTGNSTSPSATSGTPSTSTDLVVSYMRINTATVLTIPGGYTLLQEGGSNSQGSAYKSPVSTAQTATWSSTNSGSWATQVILIQPPASGTPGATILPKTTKLPKTTVF